MTIELINKDAAIDALVNRCNTLYKITREQSFKIIEKDMEDGLELIEVYRTDIRSPPKLRILLQKEFVKFLMGIEDYVYKIRILDINEKIIYLEEEKCYDFEKEILVNRFLINFSLILLRDNEMFLDYLIKTHEMNEIDDLLKYNVANKRGWVRPKFNILRIYTNFF